MFVYIITMARSGRSKASKGACSCLNGMLPFAAFKYDFRSVSDFIAAAIHTLLMVSTYLIESE